MIRFAQVFAPAIALTFVLVGCGVPYKEIDGDSGGHSHVRLSEDVFEVTYLSNSSGEASVRMQELVLLRAAELALEHGYTHFSVEDQVEDAQTKWRTTTTSTPIMGGPTLGGGISTGGITLGSPSGGMGTMGGRSGVISSSTPVPVLIPELTLRVRTYRGVPTTTYKGDLYDAARLRDILAVKYGIPIKNSQPGPSRQAPQIQVIE